LLIMANEILEPTLKYHIVSKSLNRPIRIGIPTDLSISTSLPTLKSAKRRTTAIVTY